MLTKHELDLTEEFNYYLTRKKDINDRTELRVYKHSSKETIVSIYNKNTNSSILLYNTTLINISKYINTIDSSKKKTKQKKKN
jgi:hypothetical protein